MLKDICDNRDEYEITLYSTPIDQHGPYQNSALPVIWKIFTKRLNMRNVLFYQTPNYHNNYLGLFDSYVEIDKLLEGGNKHASSNSMTEIPFIIDRFLHSIKDQIYDGLINLGTVNCQPAMNSQAIIRLLANKSEVPYAAVDCEGPWLSSNQIRLLEKIAVLAYGVLYSFMNYSILYRGPLRICNFMCDYCPFLPN